MRKNKRSLSETSLDVVLDIPRAGVNGRSGWSLEDAKKLVTYLADRKRLKTIPRMTQYVELEKLTGFSKYGCMGFVLELRRAARKGYSLEQYFKENRPLRAGREVVA